MRYCLWIMLILLSLTAASAEDDGCADVASVLSKLSYVNVHLFRTARGFEIIAQVDHHDNARLLVDTGSTRTILDESWMRKRDYRFMKATGPLRGIGGQVEVKTAAVKNIKVGHCSTGPTIVAISSLEHVNGIRKGGEQNSIDGILGVDFLTRHSAIMDTKRSVLYLKTE